MSAEGLKPIILPASWVRLTTSSGKGVPMNCRGMDAVVLEAPVVKNQGGEKEHSPRNFESQPDDTVFQVRVRENGEVLSVKRNAFTATSPDAGGLVGAAMQS